MVFSNEILGGEKDTREAEKILARFYYQNVPMYLDRKYKIYIRYLDEKINQESN